jgi:DNA (cytosine-5)-methyltransferase 1
MKSLIHGHRVDVIIGGPPCQGFSSLRPFRSSDDEDPRNSLF